MTDQILISIFVLSVAIIGYHYIIYPVLLSFINITRYSLPKYFHRNYIPSHKDEALPSIHIIIPAYNEERYIKDRILNLAIIDYPEDRFKITVISDGLEDDTYRAALNAVSLPECKHLNIDIHALEENIGKIAIINQFVPAQNSDIVVLSDASAITSINCLLIIAAYFQQDKRIGAVCGNYQFVPAQSSGEQAYWNYQRRIKIQESMLGSTIGLHGAFYAFKSELFQTIPHDTINDDVILPLSIIRQGFKCLYDPRLITIELEPSSDQMNFQRRVRIAAGNLQQSIRNMDLLLPRHRRFAFSFFSGKFLRPFIPLLLICSFISSILLATEYLFFLSVIFILLALTTSTLYYLLTGSQPDSKIAKTLFYIAAGHIAMTLGVFSYVFHSPHKRWRKIKSSPRLEEPRN
ncbi:glycosyltransferase family 2 protein [uncultured Endozoicomonas sp.]|uniref:glycosyltransferase family 2 protein n=1 Tax=uncultured Endozoicomonas sp. TaxID=432652 RepID=UPI0026059F31|nr:glycosyltransferase family 2 protein [uncultured Endozoicomonas sp.]